MSDVEFLLFVCGVICGLIVGELLELFDTPPTE